jgi:hypothetical protein
LSPSTQLAELYGVEVGHDLISRVTDEVLDDVREWQTRPLEDVYPILFLDAADEHVADAALFELGQHLQPELGSLGGLKPEPEHVAFAFQVDADRDVAGAVSDGATIAHLHDQDAPGCRERSSRGRTSR